MFGLGLPELLIILIILVIVFGVGKLADIGPALGKAIRGFRKGLTEDEEPSSKRDDQHTP